MIDRKAEPVDGYGWSVDYAGDCKKPIGVASNSTKSLFVRYKVRCRKCGPCLRAKRNYWGFAAMRETMETQEHGRRTWFGTLTFTPEMQAELALRAREKSPTPNAAWWDDPMCDHRFAHVREEVIHELQKYWKRLRKGVQYCEKECCRKRKLKPGEWAHPPAVFKYFAVLERHKSGHPHLHYLLHEQDQPIRKREMVFAWGKGHVNVSIVGGESARAAAPEKAAWYVVKYLHKSAQARQLASRGYVPVKRSQSKVSSKGNVKTLRRALREEFTVPPTGEGQTGLEPGEASLARSREARPSRHARTEHPEDATKRVQRDCSENTEE